MKNKKDHKAGKTPKIEVRALTKEERAEEERVNQKLDELWAKADREADGLEGWNKEDLRRFWGGESI